MYRGRNTFPGIITVIIAFAALALLISACSEDPTEENALTAALPLGEVEVHDTTIFASGTTTFKEFIPMNGKLNLLGMNDGYTALLPLAFFAAGFPVRDTVLVESATLTLKAVTWTGNSTAPFRFTVHRILRNWDQTTLTWDSVQSGFYDPGVTYGEYAEGAAPDTHSVVVDLDTALVRAWLQSSTDTTTTKFGIILVPTASTNIVRGFEGFESFPDSALPRLKIIATNVAGTTRDTLLFNLGVDTFVGNIDNLNSDPGLIYAQAGVVYRSTLQFDVSFVPRGALINKAEMQLLLDPATTRLTKFTSDTVVSPHVILDAADNSVFSGDLSSSFGNRKEGTSHLFAFSVPEAVQFWVQGSNNGFLLKTITGPETGTFELYTFFNHAATDSAARPRMQILYTTAKER
ncbi:MAG: DNRLRE domain-containing protein [Bacteroidota bacterium]